MTTNKLEPLPFDAEEYAERRLATIPAASGMTNVVFCAPAPKDIMRRIKVSLPPEDLLTNAPKPGANPDAAALYCPTCLAPEETCYCWMLDLAPSPLT